jgi:hypothetical protein
MVLVDKDVADKRGFSGTKRKVGEVEFLVRNYQLIPPSLHPTGISYEWVRPLTLEKPFAGIYLLGGRELEKLLSELGPEERKQIKTITEREVRELRELTNEEILRLIELLRTAYKPGSRQLIWLYFSGWCAKARVSYFSVARVLRALYEGSGDEDDLRSRGSCIIYSYEKAGYHMDKSALAQVLGVEPYGPESLEKAEIKGKTGLQEILERELGEEGAVEVIREIEEILGTASPFRDSIIALLDYEKQLFAVANLNKLVTVRATLLTGKNTKKLQYKERVFVGAPTEVTVFINPLGGLTKYQVKWEAPTRQKPLVIGPCPVGDVLDRLKAEGFVICSRLAGDVLNALVDAYIRKGRAEVKEEIDKPGFYWIDGRLVAVKVDLKGDSERGDVIKLPKPSREELREALSLLVELGEKWYSHIQDRFAEMVRWGVQAPFIFAYKQRGKWMPYPYLFGASEAGKTTLCMITLYIWGIKGRERTELHGKNIDNVARLGEVLSLGTFPVLVNEAATILGDSSLVEMLKAAIESTVARGKFVKGVYTEIPALAPLMLTSNAKKPPEDEGFVRRAYLYPFTHGMVLSQEKVREFEEKVKLKLEKLRAIGGFVAHYVVEKGLPEKPEDLPRLVLEEAFREAGLKAPDWLWKVPERVTLGEIGKELVESIRVCLAEAVNEAFARNVGRIVVTREDGKIQEIGRGEASFEDRLSAVLDNRLIPWMILKSGKVFLTSGVLGELEKKGIEGINGLRDLAEILGWTYIRGQSIREGEKVRNISVVAVDYETLRRFLVVEGVEEQLT